jgi:hypothetical protein
VLRLLAMVSLLSPALALADARFDALRASAEPYDGGLGEFLEEYTGDCGQASNTATCRNKSRELQARARGKRFYALIREDAAGMLGMSTGRAQGGDFTVEVTPFFPSREHALTNAAPKKTDAQGNPIFPVILLPGTLPDGETVESIQRTFRNRGVRLELLFRPEELWALPRKGGGKLVGVKAKLDALLVTTRTGEVLARYEAP